MAGPCAVKSREATLCLPSVKMLGAVAAAKSSSLKSLLLTWQSSARPLTQPIVQSGNRSGAASAHVILVLPEQFAPKTHFTPLRIAGWGHRSKAG